MAGVNFYLSDLPPPKKRVEFNLIWFAVCGSCQIIIDN